MVYHMKHGHLLKLNDIAQKNLCHIPKNKLRIIVEDWYKVQTEDIVIIATNTFIKNGHILV